MNGSHSGFNLTPSLGIVGNDVVLCSQAAKTEPSFYFEFWHFHMSICSRRHHCKRFTAIKMMSWTFLTDAGMPAPHRGVDIEPLFLPPYFVSIVTFSGCPILYMDF